MPDTYLLHDSQRTLQGILYLVPAVEGLDAKAFQAECLALLPPSKPWKIKRTKWVGMTNQTRLNYLLEKSGLLLVIDGEYWYLLDRATVTDGNP